jgi:sn-glycerol 3-phosphate transport system substrate-binding protein
MMSRRRFAATLAGAAMARRAAAAERLRINLWHAMGGALEAEFGRLAAGFNASQVEYTVEPVFKGGYAETMTATIAAWRAGVSPHLAQVFEVGTGSMLTAGEAVELVSDLAGETSTPLDVEGLIGAARGYYSLADGRLAAWPFNVSTAMMWLNRGLLAKGGVDPEAPLATWAEIVAAARTVKARGAARVVVTTAWPIWIQFEQFAALHDVPYASEANGFGGLDAELLINARPFVHHLERLVAMAREGLFTYAGRDAAADPLFPAGETAISFNSSASRAGIARDARFAWREVLLPYDADLIAAPRNSVIGGAGLWAMTAPRRAAGEYRAVAAFLAWLGAPEQVATWSGSTGYVPVTRGGAELLRDRGSYRDAPGSELPSVQLGREPVTQNSRGFRLGRMPELRTIMSEEIEQTLQGEKAPRDALDAAVARGNRVLRDFERAARP